MMMRAEQVGTIFGSVGGSTEEIAGLIAETFGADVAAEPLDISDVKGSLAETFSNFECLVVGCCTYNTDADTERSGTDWDSVYYTEMQDLAASGMLKGKHVAIFGLGDQVTYAENFLDGPGELHDVFEAAGCQMFGYTSTSGYSHEGSKAQRGDKFTALACDTVNQDDQTEQRVQAWVAQLNSEGFLDETKNPLRSGAVTDELLRTESISVASLEDTSNIREHTSSATEESEVPGIESAVVEAISAELAAYARESPMPQKGFVTPATGEFVPFYNSDSGYTVWISANNHRESIYTFDEK